MGRILRRLKQLRLPSFDRGDHAIDSERSVENTDALAATAGREGEASGVVQHAGYPPAARGTDRLLGGHSRTLGQPCVMTPPGKESECRNR